MATLKATVIGCPLDNWVWRGADGSVFVAPAGDESEVVAGDRYVGTVAEVLNEGVDEALEEV